MRKENKVSIWIGNFSSLEELNQYTYVDFIPEDEEILSQFQRNFGVEYYDMDFSDIIFMDETENLEDLLYGISYSESFWDEIEEWSRDTDKSYNSVIAIYDYEYNKSVSSCGDVKFLSVTNYHKYPIDEEE